MQAVLDAVKHDIELVPVVVVTRAFPARPSAVPNVRDFVCQQLAQTSLTADDVRVLDRRVADVLLDAAGPGGTIQVMVRIFADSAEIDVLETTLDEAMGTTGVIGTVRASPAVHNWPAVATTAGNRAVTPTPKPARVESHGPAMSFAEWLAGALRREGMTMETAARQLKVSVKTVSRWVRGATEPRLCDLTRIRELFGELPFP
jgi:hypothetical protein